MYVYTIIKMYVYKIIMNLKYCILIGSVGKF